MYIAGLVIPVPETKREAYRAWAAHSAGLLSELGCREVVETWEDRVPDGQTTDFRKAVAARPGERIVFAWQIWPDRETLEKAEAAMATDPRFDPPADLPFDSRRAILGCFRPLLTSGDLT